MQSFNEIFVITLISVKETFEKLSSSDYVIYIFEPKWSVYQRTKTCQKFKGFIHACDFLCMNYCVNF